MNILARIVAWLGFWGCVLIGIILFYEGVPILKNWPFNQIPYAGKIFEGEIERRIAARNAKQELTVLVRRQEAESVLGEREAVIYHKERQRRLNEAQARLNAANSTNQERNVFLERSRQLKQERIRALESIIENYTDLPKDKRTKVITEYVETFKSQKPVFSGDTKPSAGFLREYQRLNDQAREIERRALSTSR